jgi:hypothetical protein
MSKAVKLLVDIENTDTIAVGYLSLLLVATAAAWFRVLVTLHTRLDWFCHWQWGFVAISAVLVAGGWLYLGWVMAIPMNFIFLAHCVLFIVQGAHEANAKLVSIACLLFSVLVVTRYVALLQVIVLLLHGRRARVHRALRAERLFENRADRSS